MQAGLFRAPRKGSGGRRLQQRLAARQGQPAAALRIEYAVAQHGVHHLIHRHSTAHYFQRAGRAVRHAGAAGDTARPVQRMRALLEPVRASGADGARTADDALVHIKTQLGRADLALRIVAPGAVERTAFEQHCRPYPRPVLH